MDSRHACIPYVQLCRLTLILYAWVYIIVHIRMATVLSPSQTYQTHNKYLIRHEEAEWNLAQQWEYTPICSQDPVLYHVFKETWREKIRKAEARAAELEKEGMLGSSLKRKLVVRQTSKTGLLESSSNYHYLFPFANMWHRLWRKTELEVRNTDLKHVLGRSNWPVHK